MTKTFCGKDCELCTQKEQLGCWGCTDDENRIQYRTCEIANCCWAMRYETCGNCYAQEECEKLKKSNDMPSYRMQQKDAEAMKKADALRKAPFMAKWLMVLFGIMIVATVGSILSSEFVQESIPALCYVGTVVNIVGGLLCALIMLKLSCEEALYRSAAYCYLGSTAISLVTVLIMYLSTDLTAVLVFSLLLSIVAMIVVLLSIYYEYKAHANVVRDISYAMADKWENLWGYTVKILIALIVVMLFSGVFGSLGLIALILLMIAFLVVSLMRFVYVYEMAKLFQGVAERKE